MIPEKYQSIIFSYEDEFVDKAREIYSMTDAEILLTECMTQSQRR